MSVRSNPIPVKIVVAGGFGVDLHLANAVGRRPGSRAGTGEDGVADRHGEHDT